MIVRHGFMSLLFFLKTCYIVYLLMLFCLILHDAVSERQFLVYVNMTLHVGTLRKIRKHFVDKQPVFRY